MARGIGVRHRYPQDFRYLMLNGTRSDRARAPPGQDWLSLYDYVRHA